MKTYLILLALLTGIAGSAAATAPESHRDSVIITVGAKARIVVYAESKEELRKLLRYDLNALLRDMRAKIDSTSEAGTTRIVFQDVDGGRYVKDTVVTVVTDDKKVVITVDKDGVERLGDDSTTTSSQRSDRPSRWYRNSNEGFMVALGMNAFAVKDAAGYNPDDLALRYVPWKYVSIGFAQAPTLIRGEKAALQVRVGVDVSWYNFMFEGNRLIRQGTDRVEFPTSPDNLEKSKLSVSYLNFSLMPKLAFRRGFISHLSAGGYVGYRMGSHSKQKVDEGRTKERSNFYLSDLRYGWGAELGLRKFLDLFVQYDLNPLFRSGRGPEINAFSVGFRFN
jgi:hypothetical protein